MHGVKFFLWEAFGKNVREHGDVVEHAEGGVEPLGV